MADVYHQLACRATSAYEQASARVLIGIAGCPGSGKSTTAHAVCDLINNMHASTSAVILPMDGFHYTRAQLDAMQDPAYAHARRGAPFTFDADTFVACVRQVCHAGPQHHVKVPSFDHAAGDPVQGDIVVEPGHRIVLVEGNYLLLDTPPWDTLTSLFTETWFIDCDIETAMQRVFARQTSIGLSAEESQQRIAGNDRPNALEIMKSRHRASVLVPSFDV